MDTTSEDDAHGKEDDKTTQDDKAIKEGKTTFDLFLLETQKTLGMAKTTSKAKSFLRSHKVNQKRSKKESKDLTPNELARAQDAYRRFLHDWGTHYTKMAVMGGEVTVTTMIRKTKAEEKTSESTTQEANVEHALDTQEAAEANSDSDTESVIETNTNDGAAAGNGGGGVVAISIDGDSNAAASDDGEKSSSSSSSSGKEYFAYNYQVLQLKNVTYAIL